MQVDHTVEAEVVALFEQLRHDQGGRLELLVNDVWGGDPLTEWGTPFWQLNLDKGRTMLERALFSHIVTARHGAPLMVARGRGLIVEVTDGDSLDYRGNLFYDLAKTSVMRLATGMAAELGPHGVTALALTPGFLRSEAVLDHFGVSADGWRAAIVQDPSFAGSETPRYLGRAVAALAADPEVPAWSGTTMSTWTLKDRYRLVDIDGQRPDWGAFFEQMKRREGPGEES